MFRQDDLSQLFLGNSGPLKRQNEQRTQYFKDYEKSNSVSARSFSQGGPPALFQVTSSALFMTNRLGETFCQPDILNEHVKLKIKVGKVCY
jgi:hypothetical protein